VGGYIEKEEESIKKAKGALLAALLSMDCRREKDNAAALSILAGREVATRSYI